LLQSGALQTTTSACHNKLLSRFHTKHNLDEDIALEKIPVSDIFNKNHGQGEIMMKLIFFKIKCNECKGISVILNVCIYYLCKLKCLNLTELSVDETRTSNHKN
jgi:hypothetical protein